MRQSLGKTMFSAPTSSAEMYDKMLAKVTEGNALPSVTGGRQSPGRLQAKADEVTAQARAITEEEAATRLAKTEALRAARLNAPGSAPSPKVKAKQLAGPSKAKARG